MYAVVLAEAHKRAASHWSMPSGGAYEHVMILPQGGSVASRIFVCATIQC